MTFSFGYHTLKLPCCFFPLLRVYFHIVAPFFLSVLWIIQQRSHFLKFQLNLGYPLKESSQGSNGRISDNDGGSPGQRRSSHLHPGQQEEILRYFGAGTSRGLTSHRDTGLNDKGNETTCQIYRPVFSYGKRMAGTAELRHAASAELEIEIRGG